MKKSMTKYDYKSILAICVFLFYVAAFFFMDSWKGTMVNGDTSGYYTHLVSASMYGEVGDYSTTLEAFFSEYPSQMSLLDDPFWMKESAIEKNYLKYSIGVAVMELPGFIVGHAIASLSPTYEANGFSAPYVFAVNFSQIIYLIIGLYFLAFVLEKFFSRQVVIWTIVAVALGTNIFIQTTYLTIAHVFLFSCISALIFLTYNYYQKPSLISALKIGILVGLIALIRVPEITCLLIPLLWGVTDIKSGIARFLHFALHISHLLVAAVALLLVFLPQLLYWKYTSGTFILNSYSGEGFNFLEPHILKGWFSYQNGWLIYTPIMFFSLVGLFFLRKSKAVILPLIGFAGINTYIHYCYYVWNFYPGMGSRPMIESYPLLAFAFAGFMSMLLSRRIPALLTKLIIVALIFLNLLQSWQFRQSIIWSHAGSKAFYWELLGHVWPTQESLRAFDSKEFQPDSSNLELISTLVDEDFGDGVLELMDEFPYPPKEILFDENGVRAGDFIYLSTRAMRPESFKVSTRDNLESLVLKFFNEQGEQVLWTNIKIACHIDNPEYKVGVYKSVGKWDHAGFFVKVPRSANEQWRATIEYWNPGKLKLVVDDLNVELFRKP